MPPFKPQTRLGRISCGFAIAFVVWWFANMSVYWLQMLGLPLGEARPVLIGLSWIGMACGVATAATAVWAITRRQDRGLAVYLCLAPGLFAVAFLLGELLLPH